MLWITVSARATPSGSDVALVLSLCRRIYPPWDITLTLEETGS